MTTTKKPLIERYIDKEHAVGIIWCLQQHFAQISDRLDSIDVPTEIGIENEDGSVETVKLTTQQRVALLVEAHGRAGVNWQDIADIVVNNDDSTFPFEPEEIDGETVAEIISGDAPEPGHWGNAH